MQISLIIPGSIVSKKNSRIACMIGGKNCPRRPMILPSAAYKKWEKQARKEAWAQINYGDLLAELTEVWFPIEVPVHIKAFFYYKGNKPDLAGAMESISDCLQGVVWADDGQIESWDGSRTRHDLKNPRTEISISWDTCREEEKITEI